MCCAALGLQLIATETIKAGDIHPEVTNLNMYKVWRRGDFESVSRHSKHTTVASIHRAFHIGLERLPFTDELISV